MTLHNNNSAKQLCCSCGYDPITGYRRDVVCPRHDGVFTFTLTEAEKAEFVQMAVLARVQEGLKGANSNQAKA